MNKLQPLANVVGRKNRNLNKILVVKGASYRAQRHEICYGAWCGGTDMPLVPAGGRHALET